MLTANIESAHALFVATCVGVAIWLTAWCVCAAAKDRKVIFRQAASTGWI